MKAQRSTPTAIPITTPTIPMVTVPMVTTLVTAFVPAIVAPTVAVVIPIAPNRCWPVNGRGVIRLRVNLGGINHPGLRIKHRAGNAHLPINLRMSDLGRKTHRWLHHQRLRTAHLGQAQGQTTQQQGFAGPSFEQQA
jgi:hypothetical protein